jgi:hypothetical protein
MVTTPMTMKFDHDPAHKDERRYVVFSIDSDDVCPLSSGAMPFCKSTTHKHRVQVIEGFDAASDAVIAERDRGWRVKFMDRTY